MDLRYGDVERVLADAFRIEERDLGRFRARIRHLRRANAVGLPQTGSGRQIVYTVDHVRLLFVALRLNQMGMMPEVIGQLFGHSRQDILKWFANARALPDKPYRAALSLSTFGGQLGEGPLSSSHFSAFDDPEQKFNFRELVERHFERPNSTSPYIVLNITAIEKALAESIERQGRHGDNP